MVIYSYNTILLFNKRKQSKGTWSNVVRERSQSAGDLHDMTTASLVRTTICLPGDPDTHLRTNKVIKVVSQEWGPFIN
jgi:hypothetical protein